jgi:polyisoprenoid-binding protein YceI
MNPRVFSWAVAGVAVWTTFAFSQTGTYTFDAVQSKIEVEVFSGGAFGFLGHDHTIRAKRFSGEINHNASRLEQSSVALSIDSSALTVLDPNASEKDRREIQETMESPRVLNVVAFPVISFRSAGLGNLRQTGQEWEGTLAGSLTLHGTERTIAFPIRIRIDRDRLNARGEVFINQSEFGMTPISLAGGTVRVKDRVRVAFTIVAERK